jgi:hypothetical protein
VVLVGRGMLQCGQRIDVAIFVSSILQCRLIRCPLLLKERLQAHGLQVRLDVQGHMPLANVPHLGGAGVVVVQSQILTTRRALEMSDRDCSARPCEGTTSSWTSRRAQSPELDAAASSDGIDKCDIPLQEALGMHTGHLRTGK